MLCTIRTLLLQDLLTSMIDQLNSYVTDKPPKRMFLQLFQSSLFLWVHFEVNSCTCTSCTCTLCVRQSVHCDRTEISYTDRKDKNVYSMMSDQIQSELKEKHTATAYCTLFHHITNHQRSYAMHKQDIATMRLINKPDRLA